MIKDLAASDKQRSAIEWRRDKVQELQSKGYSSQREIANILKVSEATISLDLEFLRQRARYNLAKYTTTTLPEEMEISLVRLNSTIKELYKDLEDPEIMIRDKHSAMQLLNQCSELRLEILGAGVLANQISSSRKSEDKSSRFQDSRNLELEGASINKNETNTLPHKSSRSK